MTKVIMIRLIPLVCLVVIVLSVVTQYAFFFWLGLYGQSVDQTCDYRDLFWLIEVVMLLVIVGFRIFALIRKKNRRWTNQLIIAGAIFVCFQWLIFSPQSVLIHTLCHRVMATHDVAELRQFARDVHQIPNHPDGKIFWPGDLPPDIQSRYSFLKLYDGACVRESNGHVAVYWGEELRDQWGFVVTVDGAKIDPETNIRHLKILGVSDDIYFYWEYGLARSLLTEGAP